MISFLAHRKRTKRFYFQLMLIIFIGGMLGCAGYMSIISRFNISLATLHNNEKPLYFKEMTHTNFSNQLVPVTLSDKFAVSDWIRNYTLWIPQLPYTYAHHRTDDKSPWHTLPLLFVPNTKIKRGKIPVQDEHLSMLAQLLGKGQSVVEKSFVVRKANIQSRKPFIVLLDYPTIDLTQSPNSDSVMSPIVRPEQDLHP